MAQTGRRSIATHILAVKIALAATHFHSFGVARQGAWITWVNKAALLCFIPLILNMMSECPFAYLHADVKGNSHE
jgi:hypothetical protein